MWLQEAKKGVLSEDLFSHFYPHDAARTRMVNTMQKSPKLRGIKLVVKKILSEQERVNTTFEPGKEKSNYARHGGLRL